MAYGWIITKDCIAEPHAKPGTLLNALGLTGPRGITPEIEAKLQAGEGHEFRLYDDDGELYYEGRLVGDRTAEPDAFAPLEDFGAGNAGCTEIRYRNGNTWETL